MSVTPEKVMTRLVQAVEDKKAMDVVTLDLRGISLIADYFVICHGNSDTQVQAIATEAKKLADELGIPVKGLEGFDNARWVLIDLGEDRKSVV